MRQILRFGLVGQFRVHEFLVLFITILSRIYFELCAGQNENIVGFPNGDSSLGDLYI